MTLKVRSSPWCTLGRSKRINRSLVILYQHTKKKKRAPFSTQVPLQEETKHFKELNFLHQFPVDKSGSKWGIQTSNSSQACTHSSYRCRIIVINKSFIVSLKFRSIFRGVYNKRVQILRQTATLITNQEKHMQN